MFFYEDRLEFTGIDDKNVFLYSDIAGVETYRDTKASLKKNFIDRHSLIIITRNDETVTTVDIGLTSKGFNRVQKGIGRIYWQGKYKN